MKKEIDKYTSRIATLTYHIMNTIIPGIWAKDLRNKEPYKYLYTTLFKTNNALDTSNILANNLIEKPSTTDSLFLILRTTISDLIIYDYLIRISKTDRELEENIHRMYMDHIEITIKELRQFYRSAYRKSENEINKKINELKSMYPNLYEKDGSIKLNPFKEPLYVSSMVKKIISQKEKNENIEYLITAKEYYDKFSKYEHFGALTLDITHRQFKNERVAEVFQDIFWANKVILFYLNNLICIWLKTENKEYHIFNNLMKEITDLNWIK